MKENYKIYLNGISVYLCQEKCPLVVQKKDNPVEIYPVTSKATIKKIITAIEVGSLRSNIVLCSEDIKKLKNQFFSCFTMIEAGGGVVRNKRNEYLLIHRKKKWDLPKGKLESDESPRGGAVREVEEEPGVRIINIYEKLCKTYHTYKLRDEWILKKTHWYMMKGDSTSRLRPQTEEGITRVEWVGRKMFRDQIKDSYPTFNSVLIEEKTWNRRYQEAVAIQSL